MAHPRTQVTPTASPPNKPISFTSFKFDTIGRLPDLALRLSEPGPANYLATSGSIESDMEIDSPLTPKQHTGLSLLARLGIPSETIKKQENKIDEDVTASALLSESVPKSMPDTSIQENISLSRGSSPGELQYPDSSPSDNYDENLHHIDIRRSVAPADDMKVIVEGTLQPPTILAAPKDFVSDREAFGQKSTDKLLSVLANSDAAETVPSRGGLTIQTQPKPPSIINSNHSLSFSSPISLPGTLSNFLEEERTAWEEVYISKTQPRSIAPPSVVTMTRNVERDANLPLSQPLKNDENRSGVSSSHIAAGSYHESLNTQMSTQVHDKSITSNTSTTSSKLVTQQIKTEPVVERSLLLASKASDLMHQLSNTGHSASDKINLLNDSANTEFDLVPEIARIGLGASVGQPLLSHGGKTDDPNSFISSVSSTPTIQSGSRSGGPSPTGRTVGSNNPSNLKNNTNNPSSASALPSLPVNQATEQHQNERPQRPMSVPEIEDRSLQVNHMQVGAGLHTDIKSSLHSVSPMKASLNWPSASQPGRQESRELGAASVPSSVSDNVIAVQLKHENRTPTAPRVSVPSSISPIRGAITQPATTPMSLQGSIARTDIPLQHGTKRDRSTSLVRELPTHSNDAQSVEMDLDYPLSKKPRNDADITGDSVMANVEGKEPSLSTVTQSRVEGHSQAGKPFSAMSSETSMALPDVLPRPFSAPQHNGAGMARESQLQPSVNRENSLKDVSARSTTPQTPPGSPNTPRLSDKYDRVHTLPKCPDDPVPYIREESSHFLQRASRGRTQPPRSRGKRGLGPPSRGERPVEQNRSISVNEYPFRRASDHYSSERRFSGAYNNRYSSEPYRPARSSNVRGGRYGAHPYIPARNSDALRDSDLDRRGRNVHRADYRQESDYHYKSDDQYRHRRDGTTSPKSPRPTAAFSNDSDRKEYPNNRENRFPQNTNLAAETVYEGTRDTMEGRSSKDRMPAERNHSPVQYNSRRDPQPSGSHTQAVETQRSWDGKETESFKQQQVRRPISPPLLKERELFFASPGPNLSGSKLPDVHNVNEAMLPARTVSRPATEVTHPAYKEEVAISGSLTRPADSGLKIMGDSAPKSNNVQGHESTTERLALHSRIGSVMTLSETTRSTSPRQDAIYANQQNEERIVNDEAFVPVDTSASKPLANRIWSTPPPLNTPRLSLEERISQGYSPASTITKKGGPSKVYRENPLERKGRTQPQSDQQPPPRVSRKSLQNRFL